MIRRLLAATILTLVPALALADDTPVTADPAPQNSSAAAQPAPAPQQGSSSASFLGPQSGASSTSDGSSLQSAGNNNSPLQSDSGGSTGLTAPSANSLQGSAASNDLKVILGNESDGAPITPGGPVASETGNTLLDTAALLLVLGFMGLVWLLRAKVASRFADALE